MSGGAETVVLGSGPVALAHALFAARHGPVLLAARSGSAAGPGTPEQLGTAAAGVGRAVESVPAPLLTLLLELGVVPAELDVAELNRQRLVAWEVPSVEARDVRAAAHLERSALLDALWRRVRASDSIRVEAGGRGEGAGIGRLVDAGGRGSTRVRWRWRPRPAWLATTATAERQVGLDGRLHLAAGPDGYAYRLASARWLTVGWVAPGHPPRSADQLAATIEAADAGWLLDGVELAGPLWCRVASVAIPGAGPGDPPDLVRLGDAALARDALASQGLSLGLSDARLAARPDWTPVDATARTADAARRHLRSLAGILATCRHRREPVWRTYAEWLSSLPKAADPM